MKSQSVTIQRETIEQIEVPIETTADPTGYTVSFAFPALGSRPSSFTAGTWQSTAVGDGRDYKALAISPTVGATGASVVLTAGTYGIYVKITGGTETPVLYAGQVIVE